MNPVTDRIYIIPMLEGNGRPHKWCRVGNQAKTTSNNLAVEFEVQIRVGECVQLCDADVLQVGAAQTLEEIQAGAEWNPIQVYEFLEDEETLLQSTLLPSNVVQYNSRAIYKSTLVGELNGNPFFLKDRLTRIKNSVYFNNTEDYLSAANSTTTAFLGLRTDCGLLFMQSPTLGQSSGVRAAQKRNRCSAQVGRPAAVTSGPDIGTWWLGRVQKMRRRVGQTWGLCRNPIDLMAHTSTSKKVLDEFVSENT